MKKIKININDPTSIDNAITTLRTYSKNLKQATKQIAEELANLGAQVVDGAYSMGDSLDAVEYDVYTKRMPGGYVIVAEGNSVMFLEFGTGIMTEDYEKSGVGLPPIVPGSYSQTEGMKHFIPGEHEYWFYERRKYTGTPATKGFYFANKQMQEQAEKIVRKALRKL